MRGEEARERRLNEGEAAGSRARSAWGMSVTRPGTASKGKRSLRSREPADAVHMLVERGV